MKVTAIIPCRLESKRFPNKPLTMIMGKTMVERVYTQAAKSDLIDSVCVATDSERIFAEVEKFGGKAVMTSNNCRSGTDRVAESARKLGLAGHDVIVNIQGDQPVLHPECLNDLVQPFLRIPELKMSTLAYALEEEKEIADPNNVKVVFADDGYALYFSRSKIPYDRDKQKKFHYYKHLGIYAYSYSFLQEFSSLEKSALEGIESLEQLRVLENGHRIMVSVTEYDSPSVDDPADLGKINEILSFE